MVSRWSPYTRWLRTRPEQKFGSRPQEAHSSRQATHRVDTTSTRKHNTTLDRHNRVRRQDNTLCSKVARACVVHGYTHFRVCLLVVESEVSQRESFLSARPVRYRNTLDQPSFARNDCIIGRPLCTKVESRCMCARFSRYIYGVSYPVFDVVPPRNDCGPFHAQEPPRDAPGVDLRPLLPC